MSDTLDYILPGELIDAARKVIEANRARGKQIAVAESCTGGLISAALTEIPGRVPGGLRHLFQRGQGGDAGGER
jgi:hypothetical protein